MIASPSQCLARFCMSLPTLHSKDAESCSQGSGWKGQVIIQLDVRATGAQGTVVPVPIIQGVRSVVQAIYSLEVDCNLHTARKFRSWLCRETA